MLRQLSRLRFFNVWVDIYRWVSIALVWYWIYIQWCHKLFSQDRVKLIVQLCLNYPDSTKILKDTTSYKIICLRIFIFLYWSWPFIDRWSFLQYSYCIYKNPLADTKLLKQACSYIFHSFSWTAKWKSSTIVLITHGERSPLL